MYSKSLVAVAITLLSVSLQASAHAIISPALGVTGTPVRNDVQKPSKNAECGSVNIANTINTSGTVALSSTGTFNANITNFNAGVDGSRQVTALVDPTGTGSSFQAATVTKNGDENPTDVGSQELTVQLPQGTKCTGGSSKDLCLVSFTTAGGFGNCVAVQQAGASNAAAGAAASSAAPAKGSAAAASGTAAVVSGTAASVSGTAAAATGTAAAASAAAPEASGAAACAAVKGHKGKGKGKRDSRAVGSRAARAVRAAVEAWSETE